MYNYICVYTCVYIYIYTHMYIHIYLSISLSLSIYIYIYRYRYKPHLGLMNAPLFVFFLQTTFVTINLLSKRPDIYTIMAKTLSIVFPPSWGDPFARIKYGTFI